MSNPYEITVKYKDDVFEIKPYKVNPDKVGTTEPVTITWTLKDSTAGVVFPQNPPDAADGIEFKPGTGPANPTWTKGATVWSVTYDAPADPVLWRYTVRVKRPDGTIIGFDPEVDNVRPGPGPLPEEDDKDKDKDRDRDK